MVPKIDKNQFYIYEKCISQTFDRIEYPDIV